MRLFLGLFLLLLLSIACEPETYDPLQITNQGEYVIDQAQEKKVQDAPARSGYFVIRQDAVNPFLFIDHDSGLSVAVNVDNAAFCDPFPNFGAFELVPTQTVDIPNDPLRQHILNNGESYVEVFDGVIDVNEFICDFVANTPLLASGYVSTLYVDNDITIYLRDDPKNKNSFGFNIKGTLTDASGDPVNIKANYHAVWDGEGVFAFNSHEVVKVRLRDK